MARLSSSLTAEPRGIIPCGTPRSGSAVRPVLRLDQVFVHLRAAIPVELPGLADFRDEVEVHVPDDQLLVYRVLELIYKAAEDGKEIRP